MLDSFAEHNEVADIEKLKCHGDDMSITQFMSQDARLYRLKV